MDAPGKPGVAPHWTSGRKAGVGAALAGSSHVWFTLERGILSEVYYPRIDQAALRELGFIVTDGERWFSEEKIDTSSRLRWLEEGVPAYQIENVCGRGAYRIEKTLITDPDRHVVLQRTRFTAEKAASSGRHHLFVLAAPHLGNSGADNDAFLGDYQGIPMLFAERSGYGLALACSAPWLARSAGYVGVSDGSEELRAHGRITREYQAARSGNVALTGEIDYADGADFVLALGFGRTATEAGHRARLSLNHGFAAALERYTGGWREWQRSLRSFGGLERERAALHRASTAVVAVHESKEFPGAFIASLSFPWGGELDAGRERGGYHLVWPRDACEAAGALLALDATDSVGRTLDFLAATQRADGSWSQNLWLDGSPFWTGVQLDEAAAPVLLLDLARRRGQLERNELERFWPMVRGAAGFIAKTGPLTPEDRWEEASGLTPYSLASAIAALLVAAELAEERAEAALADFLRDTADLWNDSIEAWLYAEHSPLAREHGVSGYYVRFAPASHLDGRSALVQTPVRLRGSEPELLSTADRIVSVDALALVRFGLRRADDPRVLDTVRIIDALLCVDTPAGPCYRRYNHDGYGEHADGAPFDGSGIGRPWPLLVGERAHYELALGRVEKARELCGVLEAMAGPTLLLPEQIWDAPAIPERGLFPGGATNSARPLVWAHAEYIKLIRSLADGRVFDCPPQTVERYLTRKVQSRHAVWRFDRRTPSLRPGRILRIETFASARVRWSDDGWRTAHDSEATDLGIGLFVTDLPTARLAPGEAVVFTCYWHDAGKWEGQDFRVLVHGEATAERSA